MKNLLKFFSCLLIVSATFFLPKKSLATVFTIDIALTGGQEVPANASTGLGNLTGTYNDVSNTLSFNLVFTGLLNPTTAAHFHGPAAPGVNAPVVIGFAGFPGGVMSGAFSNSYILTAAQETELLCGQWYVNVHTTGFPGGEIRGQLKEAPPLSFDITLAGTQEVPTNASTGIGNLTGTYTDATNVLSFNLVFTGLVSSTTAAHFHGPAAPGVNASIVIGFTGFPTGVTTGSYSNSYVLTAAQETQLLTGQWYVNVHSTIFPGGEIRGQLLEGTLPSNCNPPPPVITSFTPSSGPIGTSVTITGTNFNAVPANNIVYFGAVKALVIGGSSTSLTVTVPSGATYHPISVLDNATGLSGYSSKPFITTFANPFGTGIPANFYKPKVDFATGSLPRNVATGDLDGDGKADLVVANGSSDNISILRNQSIPGNISGSSFVAKVDFAIGTFVEYVAIGDVDGDGKPDLVVVNNNKLSILRNTSTSGSITLASFAAKVDFDLVFTGPVFVAIADLDGDGKPELVAVNASSNSVSILRNTSIPGSINASSFAAKVNFTAGFTPYSVAIGDVDGDGKPDLAFANAAAGANTVSVLRNTSTPGIINASSFDPKVDFATGSTPRSVAIGDIDGDGKPDLVVANNATAPASTTISVLRNTSTPGAFTASTFAAKQDFTAGTAPRAVAIGDLDGDGKPDVAVANINSNNISVLRNTSTSGSIGASSFAAKVDFTTLLSPVSVVIVDIDGDGIPEIAAANGSSSNAVSVFQINPAAVPVTLTNVKAYQKNMGVQVEWTTHQEINIDRYEVERSQDGRHFTQIGSVRSTGNSSTVKKYELFDAAPFTGVNFYRIKIVEAGQVTYSTVVKVSISNNRTNEINIYPNPITGESIVVQLNLGEGNYSLSLTNKLGQVIVTKTIVHAGGSATEIIESPKVLAVGVYQLKVSGEGVNMIRQVIKN